MVLPNVVREALKLGWANRVQFNRSLGRIASDLKRESPSPPVEYLEPYEAIGAVSIASRELRGSRELRDTMKVSFRKMLRTRSLRDRFLSRALSEYVTRLKRLEQALADWQAWDDTSTGPPNEAIDVTVDNLMHVEILGPSTELFLAKRGFHVTGDSSFFKAHEHE